ncbi:MAG: ribonuclease Z [Bacteroidota bacterium]
MTIDKEDNLIIVSQADTELSTLLQDLKDNYASIQGVNLILVLTASGSEISEKLSILVEASMEHKSSNKSFVLVSEVLDYDGFPEGVSIAPTVQEARDIIEMEEIERDLGL